MLRNIVAGGASSMSYSGAIPVDTEQSDSRILIEACLARVREDAGLDAEPVLPPLHMLLGKPQAAAPTRMVVGPSARELPSPEAIVRGSVRPATVTTAKIDRRDLGIVSRMRWPVVLCGFIAGIFGGVALMKSPVGQKPAVQHVVRTAQSHIEHAYAATVAAKTRLVKR